MKIKIKTIIVTLNLALLCCFLLTTCKKDEKISSVKEKSKKIILRERPTGDFKLFDEKLLLQLNPKSVSISAELPPTIELKYYLGRAYNSTNAEFGSSEGVRLPVINLDKFVIDYPDFLPSYFLGQSEAKAFSFTGFNRYFENSRKKTKITGGSSLNFLLFSIGSKHSFERIFTSTIDNNERNVYGELNVTIKDTSHEIIITSAMMDKIKDKYLQQSFMDQLYNLPPYELIQRYGPFVITGFYSGGRATAFFTGRSFQLNATETREKNMENSINASFKIKKDAASSKVDFGLGNESINTVTRENKIERFQIAYRTYGGGYGFPSFTVPKSVDQVNVDLGPWTSSMNDKTKHVLVDFKDNGLLPLSSLIREKNLSFYADRSMYVEQNWNLQEPELAGVFYNRSTPSMAFPALALRTRFGDYIVIKMGNALIDPNLDQDNLIQWTQTFSPVKIPFFNLKVSVDLEETTGFSGKYVLAIPEFNETTVKKYHDVTRGGWYLLSEVNGRKIAFYIPYDFLFDSYGIRNWVNNMPETTISPEALNTYTIIAF